jgi:hypothetical protein
MGKASRNRIVISVPLHLLRNAEIPGSVFAAKLLAGMPMPEELKQAIELVSSSYPDSLCLVRPEIFTNGASRAWLDERLGNIAQHVCISDGSAVKVMDGMENHVFLYDLAQHRNRTCFQNLANWAPEVFSHIRSQINSFQAAEFGDGSIQPPTTLLLPQTRRPGIAPELYEFSLPSNSLEESAKWIVERGPIGELSLAAFREITYAPMTQSNARDPHFCAIVAQSIAQAYFQPQQCVLLRLPGSNAEQPDAAVRIQAAIHAARSSNVVLPRVPAKNVFLLTRDLPEEQLEPAAGRISLIFDETFEFWRYTRELYRRLLSVQYLFGGDARRLQQVAAGMTQIIGTPPVAGNALQATVAQLITWHRRKCPPRKKKNAL